MSLVELKADLQQLQEILEKATRPRVRDAILRAKVLVEQEIVTQELKESLAQRRPKEEQPAKRYLTELNGYGWDQSDKYVKLFITLAGADQCKPEDVELTLTESSLQLRINNLAGRDYGLAINNLLKPIDASKSYHKNKANMVIVYLKKVDESTHWEFLTSIEKRIKDKSTQELMGDKDDPDPSKALVNMMKKMYNEGDSKTKQMISKAWTESQEKSRAGLGPGPTTLPDF